MKAQTEQEWLPIERPLTESSPIPAAPVKHRPQFENHSLFQLCENSRRADFDDTKYLRI